MIGLDKAIAKIEKKMINGLGDRLQIVTDIDEDDLLLSTASYWDGILVSQTEMDLSPLVNAVLKRVQG